ncbi:GNAT family N-acetyltransferase [Chitinophaga sp. Cy-1792]|uniref:GNAT family N-acetyltransferase n=1 Tax=Chitinophaga sp. Cy-1792 TaxID=2608339 RepID=UPI00141FB6AB|nr:GNAT family protein [Chitinophaga sp. Cy-1792]NIG53809.1 GNAT family N-acetyltransferase [Chitinophaga sp. Cy-1792]
MHALPDIFPVLITSRLALQAISMDMLEEIYYIFSDPQVVKFYNLRPLAGRGKAMELIQYFQKRFKEKEGIRWAITIKDTQHVIGTIGINKFDKNNHRCTIGYDLASNWWKRGYMSEALHGFLEYVFKTLDVNRVEAEVMKDNADSCLLLEKHGFVREGLLRDHMYWQEQYHDMYMYAILKKDFQ